MKTPIHPQPAQLAVNGGSPVRSGPLPRRKLFGAEERQAVLDLFDRAMNEGSDCLGYNGPVEQGYCEDFCSLMGGGFADGVNSGTNAVYVALAALELEPLSEVVVPPISDPGGVMPVGMVGCVPVAADSMPDSFNTSAEQIEKVLSEKTRAIVIAHIGGIPVDMDPILELALPRGISIVEDCAQSHLAKYKGRLCGTLGDIAAFSTMFGKQHASGGQGGLVFTRSEELYWKARRIADRGKPFGIESGSGNVICSLNCNMDELHAAIGRANLAKLPDFIARRRAVVARIARDLEGMQSVRLCVERAGDEASYWFITIQLKLGKLSVDRNTFAKALAAEGVPASGYPFFPVTMPWATRLCVACGRSNPCELPGCPRRNPRAPAIPNAIAFEGCALRISIHEGWTEADAGDVADALRKVERAFLRC